MLKKKPVQPEFEIATGRFDCQQYGCFENATEAKYLEAINTLTWVCTQGHVSKIENFE